MKAKVCSDESQTTDKPESNNFLVIEQTKLNLCNFIVNNFSRRFMVYYSFKEGHLIFASVVNRNNSTYLVFFMSCPQFRNKVQIWTHLHKQKFSLCFSCVLLNITRFNYVVALRKNKLSFTFYVLQYKFPYNHYYSKLMYIFQKKIIVNINECIQLNQSFS